MPEAQRWPGERLGLPQSGPTSVGRPGRRIAALAIDWGFASLVSLAFFNYSSLAIIVVFFVSQVVLLGTIQASIGHRLVGLRLHRLDGAWAGLWRPVVRTALLILVIPALIWDADQRGFHDKTAGTILLRR